MSFRPLCAAIALFAAPVVFAQYPERPVRIVNPFSVGGSGDTIQRLFAQRLSERTGKTFLVENRTGAGGRIGYDAVAKSRPDGYTLAAADPGYTVLAPLFGKLNWDPESDLVPVTVYARAPFALVAQAQSRFRTFGELLDHARAHPGKLNYGTAGAGSIPHVVMESIQRQAGVVLTHVPFRSGGEAMAAVLGGSIDLVVTGVPTVVGPVKSGTVSVLAVTSRQRWPGMDLTPTLREQGVPFDTYLWYGLLAPKGTPKPVVDYLHQQVTAALDDPRVKVALQAQHVEGSGMGPAELGQMLREDGQAWSQVIRARNIAAE